MMARVSKLQIVSANNKGFKPYECVISDKHSKEVDYHKVSVHQDFVSYHVAVKSKDRSRNTICCEVGVTDEYLLITKWSYFVLPKFLTYLALVIIRKRPAPSQMSGG